VVGDHVDGVVGGCVFFGAAFGVREHWPLWPTRFRRYSISRSSQRYFPMRRKEDERLQDPRRGRWHIPREQHRAHRPNRISGAHYFNDETKTNFHFLIRAPPAPREDPKRREK
jgi:hypothetical protein